MSFAIFYTKKLTNLAYVGDWIAKISLFFICPYIVSCFSPSPSDANSAILILRMFSLASLPIWPLSFTLPNTLRGAGDIRYTMTISLASMWFCRIGVSWFLIFRCNRGVPGVWIGMFVDWYVRGILYTARFFSGHWLNKSVIKDKSHTAIH